MSLVAAPTFPPLWHGEPVAMRVDPFQKAIAAAFSEVQPGRLTYAEDDANLRAAVTLAPDMPLKKAMGALLAVELGLADALGALAPPEVAVHFSWPDRMKVNGARCGTLKAGASTMDPAAEPDWLVIGIDVPFAAMESAPGRTPDTTTLAEEGCVELSVAEFLESWSRHMLSWLNRFMDEGFLPVQRTWNTKCDELGEVVTYPDAGTFVGLDEQGGMLLRTDRDTKLIPLTAVLDPAWPTLPA